MPNCQQCNFPLRKLNGHWYCDKCRTDLFDREINTEEKMEEEQKEMSNEDWEKVEGQIWVPESADDNISGVFLGVQHDVGENKSNLYTLETPDAKQLSFWGCKILDSKMLSVKKGQEIKVVYLGRVKPDKGKEYKNFDLYKKPLAA